MRLKRYKTARKFLERAQKILEKDELANNLVLGIALRLKAGQRYGKDAPYLAIIDDGDVPVLMAVMTPPHRLLLSGGGEKRDEAIELLADDLVDAHPSTSGVLTTKSLSERFVRQWKRTTGIDAKIWMNQRMYRLTKVRHVGVAKGRMRHAVPGDLDLLADWAYGMSRDIRENAARRVMKKAVENRIKDRTLFLWEDMVPVSMAASARPMSDGITVNFVYTPPEYRCRGYATACVSSLCELLLGSGYSHCSLFADLANRTSNSIYMKIGFKPVCDFDEYEFEKPSKKRHRQ